MTPRQTQMHRLYEALASGRAFTPADALAELGIARLGARVWDLKQLGVPIATALVPVVNRFGQTVRVAKYWLEITKDAKQ